MALRYHASSGSRAQAPKSFSFSRSVLMLTAWFLVGNAGTGFEAARAAAALKSPCRTSNCCRRSNRCRCETTCRRNAAAEINASNSNCGRRSAEPVAPQAEAKPKAAGSPTKPSNKSAWKPLFDGRSLKGWKVTKFGGEGEVHVEKGRLLLEMGTDLTGITATRKVPRSNYEVSLEAMRVLGSDFFCGLTFPVRESPCTLIVGGWGGGVCGLSSIDGQDAAENEVISYREFEMNRWYRIRLRVTDQKIEAWIDDEQIIDFKTEGRRISIRSEVELSKPFGITSWQTTAALRDIRIRSLPKDKRKLDDSTTTP